MHVSNKIWEFRQVSDKNDAIVSKISKKFNISKLTANIILNRGLKSIEEISKFLNPDVKDFHDPFLLKDMDRAVKIILEAINKKRKIVVYGDYDVDGITSTSILISYLRNFLEDVEFYIPNRIEEGYGLTKNSIDNVISNGAQLIITVDCGITAIDEVEYIKENGVDVIVTDHHECKEKIPNAHAVINPKQPNCEYPFKDLAGVGVVFKLIQGLAATMHVENIIDKYIDIVALGTVADVVPLMDENRLIVKFGLNKIEKTDNFGIKALIDVSGIQEKEITATSIGYVLAPRINAAGRIGDASRGVEMFLASDKKTATDIAIELDKNNKERQQTETEILNQALEIIEQNEKIKQQKVLVVASENWHNGVVGIVASRITEKYNKPSILISLENKEGKGSGRSIPTFNIFEAITNCSEHLEKFGGHELAVGLSIKEDNIDAFREAINNIADEFLSEDDFVPIVKVDAEISKKDLNFTLMNELKRLQPHGISNPSPVFMYNSLKIVDSKPVGDNKHLKLRLEDEGLYIDSIAFNLGEISSELDIFDKVDVVCSLEMNKWNGTEKLQLNLKDIRTNFDIVFKEKYYSTLEDSMFSNPQISNIKNGMLKKIKIYDGDIFELLENDHKNLILINTFKGAKDFIKLFKNSEHKYKKLFKLFYNYTHASNESEDIVIINPYLDKIDISKFDNIVMYDLCFTKAQHDYLIESGSEIYLMNDFKSYNNNFDVLEGIIPQRDDLIKVYQYIKSRNYNNIFEGEIYSLTRAIAISYNIDINSYKLKKIFEIFAEMNLIQMQVVDSYYKIKIMQQSSEKVNIMEAKGLSKLIKIKDEFKYFINYLEKEQSS